MYSFNVMIMLLRIGTIVLFCAAVSYLAVLRKEWRWRALLFAGCYALIFGIIYLGDVWNLPPTLLFFLFCVWKSCTGSGLKRVTVGLMLASMMFAWNALFDNWAAGYLPSGMGTLSRMFRSLAVLGIYLGIRRFRPERDFELAPSLWRLLLMLCIPPMGIVSSLVLLNPRYNMDRGIFREYMLMNVVLLLVALLSFVGLFWAMLVLNRQQKLEQENALAAYNKRYYEDMEQQQFEIRRLRHDLANHLQVLLSLPAQEKDGYIQKMIENPALEKAAVCSGDATVNAVLSVKAGMMRQRGIALSAKVDIPGELPFEKPDICALFANALDNAAEGCLMLEDEKREVVLTARSAKGVLAVEVSNPCLRKDADTRGRFGGLPGTTKPDAPRHGYGLRSIQQIVKKYGGDMEIQQEEERFCLFCYLREKTL
ncbi:MAG: GHKL domain-containing protein [Lachnospiraceae bacterium]|nr:GHKL domain-containing protein [Lachnospiraceae bacterium]